MFELAAIFFVAIDAILLFSAVDNSLAKWSLSVLLRVPIAVDLSFVVGNRLVEDSLAVNS